MKRTPELVCGLIGSILATVFQLLMLLGTSALSSMPEIYEELGIYFTSSDISKLYMMYTAALIASIAAIVFAALVNKKTKLSGIMMIIAAIVIELINMLNIISFVLLMVAGVMCLARKPKQQLAYKETIIDLSSQIHDETESDS